MVMQIYNQSILQPHHAVSARFYAKEAVPKGLKGDGELTNFSSLCKMINYAFCNDINVILMHMELKKC